MGDMQGKPSRGDESQGNEEGRAHVSKGDIPARIIGTHTKLGAPPREWRVHDRFFFIVEALS